MRRFTRSAALAVSLVAALLTACGDDDVEAPSATAPVTTGAPSPSPPPPSTAPVSGYVHETGADDVIVEIAFEGGFVPVEVMFTQSPNLLVTGDGRAIETGPVIAIFPGPLLPNLQQRSISEVGIQALLAQADALGLLADVQYAGNDRIADAADTVVRISAGGATYEHRAYALGIDEQGDADPARANLAEFVTAAGDLAGAAGASTLGEQAPYDGEEYLVRATPVTADEIAGAEVEPTIVDWPAESSVRLADAAECAVVLAAEGDALFANATQLTFFVDDEATYRVAAISRLPGRGC